MLGVPAGRLAATGLGGYRTLKTSNTAYGLTGNDRIELRLTQR
jgi:flagellar motor protein MotB